jgi:hypothetical protein
VRLGMSFEKDHLVSPFRLSGTRCGVGVTIIFFLNRRNVSKLIFLICDYQCLFHLLPLAAYFVYLSSSVFSYKCFVGAGLSSTQARRLFITSGRDQNSSC